MSKQSKKPLLVNINGAAHIGVTTACNRVAMCLNAQAIATDVITVSRGIDAFLSLDTMTPTFDDVRSRPIFTDSSA